MCYVYTLKDLGGIISLGKIFGISIYLYKNIFWFNVFLN